jgi:iron complex transport system ATP-binding protein
MAEPLLEVRGLGVRRGGRALLEGISFAARPGVVLGVLGPNGAGKSTLLKAVAGLLPSSGQLRLGADDARALDARARARRLAYVPQHSVLDAALPVREVVAQGRFAHGGAWGAPAAVDRAAVDRALAMTDATALAERPFSALSYGERRLVLLARALATEAPVLLLDEPTAALDVRHALELLAVLRRRAEGGAAVLVVLHALAEAASACDEALLLAGGRCVAAGPVAEVVAAEPVRRVYGVELVPGAHFGYRTAGPPRDGGS